MKINSLNDTSALPTVSLLGQLTSFSGSKRTMDYQFPQKLHLSHRTNYQFWEGFCFLWADCGPPAVWTYKDIPSLILLFFREHHSVLYVGMGYLRSVGRKGEGAADQISFSFCSPAHSNGANATVQHPAYLYTLVADTVPDAGWLSATDSNRSSTGFLLCFSRLNLHSWGR